MPTFGSTVKWPSFHTVSLERASSKWPSFRTVSFHTITAVSLLDPAAKLLEAGAQRDMALRDDDLLLLRPSSSALMTLQSNLKPSRLGCAKASCASGVALRELNVSVMRVNSASRIVQRDNVVYWKTKRKINDDLQSSIFERSKMDDARLGPPCHTSYPASRFKGSDQ